MQRIEIIRCHGSAAMGIAPDVEAASRIQSIPKIALLSAPVDAPTLSGRIAPAGDIDILARAVSVGQPHRAVPLTLALCLAVACRIPGLGGHRVSCGRARRTRRSASAIPRAAFSSPPKPALRTAPSRCPTPPSTAPRRRLFQGEVLYQSA